MGQPKWIRVTFQITHSLVLSGSCSISATTKTNKPKQLHYITYTGSVHSKHNFSSQTKSARKQNRTKVELN